MQSLLAALLAFTFLAPEIGAAQTDSAPAPGVKDSTPVTAKAPCPPVPAGQEIAGADTAETKKVEGVAPTAVTGAGNCTPGMAMSPEQLKQMQAQVTGVLEPLKQMQAQAQMAATQANGDPQSTAAMQAMRARMAQMGAGAGMPPGAMTMSPEELIKQMQAQIGAAGDSMPSGMAPGAMGPPGEGGGKASRYRPTCPVI